MSSLQDSENYSHYDYANGSSNSSESSDLNSNGAFELLRRENRLPPPIDYNVFTLVGLRDSQEERRSARPTVEREREIVEERRRDSRKEERG